MKDQPSMEISTHYNTCFLLFAELILLLLNEKAILDYVFV